MFQTMLCRLLLKLFSGDPIFPSGGKAERPPGYATEYLDGEGHEKVDIRVSPMNLFTRNMEQSL